MGKIITITLPDNIADNLVQYAQRANTTLEELMIVAADNYQAELNDITKELEPLSHYTDDALWDVVNQRLTPTQDVRLDELTQHIKNRVSLTTSEENEYQQLNDLLMSQMLQRSAALFHLKNRGYDVSNFFQGMHE